MPLFGNKPASSVRIVPSGTSPLHKEQQTFNNLVKKIEARRACLAEWEIAIPVFRAKYTSDLLPLQDQTLDLQRQLALTLDAAHDKKRVTKGEKRKLAVLIVDLAEAVLEYKEDREIKALFDKHSESDYDGQETERQDGVKAMLESIFDLDLGDDVDMTSPEDILKRVEAQFRAQQEAHQQAAPRRKKSSQETAREARREAEEKQLSQSLREVFRKLASALHPDREPDPAEKARKTALMQRANHAYENGNLLQLLELQLELEHIDRSHLAGITAERLKHYIKILKGQVGELDMEIRRVEDDLRAEFGLDPYERIQPKGLVPMLQGDMATWQVQIAELRQQLQAAADPQQLKAWLKTISLRRQARRDFDMLF